MWVVSNADTGYSDESMRFAQRHEAIGFMSRQDEAHNLRFEFD